MELTLALRRQVTLVQVRRYRMASRAEKAAILSHLCEVNGWHRDHARKALRQAIAAFEVGQPDPPPRRPRKPVVKYGPEVIDALVKVWAVLDAPTNKRLGPVMADLVTSASLVDVARCRAVTDETVGSIITPPTDEDDSWTELRLLPCWPHPRKV